MTRYTDPNARPRALKVIHNYIPAALREHPHWVVWRWEWSQQKGRWDKPPRQIDGRKAKVSDPETWTDYETALAAYDNRHERWDGLGFVFTRDLGLVGVDVDECVDDIDTGNVTGRARDWLRELQTVVELSPSGTGVHALVRGRLPEDGSNNRQLGIEVYAHGHYLTVTGHVISRRNREPQERQEVLDRLWAIVKPPVAGKARSNGGSSGVTDHEVLERLMAEKDGKARRLLDGDTSGYDSHSEADEALCCKAAFYTRDPRQIERIWHGSGLWREKAEGRPDYVERTIARALELVTDEYQWPGETGRGPAGTGVPAVTTVTRVTGYSWGDLEVTEFPPVRWAVPDLIPEGLTLFVGRPKLGKSWLALGLCIATACGGLALGKTEVPAGEALYLALEDSPRRLKGRLLKLREDGRPPSGRDRLRIETEWPRSDEGGLDKLRAWLEGHPTARLVVIDTLARWRTRQPERGSAYTADYLALEPLQKLAAEFQVAIVVVHHDRKLKADDWVDQISGTLGLAGVADTLLGLFRERGSRDATLPVVGRDVDERSFAVRFDPLKFTWTLLGDAETFLLSPERKEVQRLLAAHGPLTPTEAAGHTGKAPGAMRKLMWSMSNAGQLLVSEGRYSLVRGGNPGNAGNPGISGHREEEP